MKCSFKSERVPIVEKGEKAVWAAVRESQVDRESEAAWESAAVRESAAGQGRPVESCR